MTEAKRLHDELFHAFSRLIARATYQDSRRLDTLAWAVAGLCLTQSVHLSAWAQLTQGRAKSAASRVRRFSRWLHHRSIVPERWYAPVMQAALACWPLSQRLFVALDTTALPPFVLIRVSLIYRGRALPLAWRAMRSQSTTVAFQDYQPVLEQARRLLPADGVITLLADRGFVHERLLHYLYSQHWHFRLRLMGKTLIHLPSQEVVAVRTLAPPAGSHRFFQHIALFASALGPAHLALACSRERPDAPWYIASDELASDVTLDEYALRWGIESAFLDEKSGGFQLQRSELASPETLERLLLIIALAMLSLTSIGASVVRVGQHRQVDPHWGRGLSYLQLGARELRKPELQGRLPFVLFQLDPTPDPLPVLAGLRKASRRSRRTDLPMAA